MVTELPRTAAAAWATVGVAALVAQVSRHGLQLQPIMEKPHFAAYSCNSLCIITAAAVS